MSKERSLSKSKAAAWTRKEGQAWFPPADQIGQGCAKKPERYPAPVKPTMSHGDPLTNLFPR